MWNVTNNHECVNVIYIYIYNRFEKRSVGSTSEKLIFYVSFIFKYIYIKLNLHTNIVDNGKEVTFKNMTTN